MEIEFRTAGLGRNSWAQGLVEKYTTKIQPFEKVSFKNIKDEKKWLQNIEPADRLWICDEKGASLSSKSFAKEISTLRDGGVKKLIFAVGGPFGLPDSVKERANRVILLSPFVVNQEVALTVILEQVFRAYTILNNHPYHNE